MCSVTDYREVLPSYLIADLSRMYFLPSHWGLLVRKLIICSSLTRAMPIMMNQKLLQKPKPKPKLIPKLLLLLALSVFTCDFCRLWEMCVFFLHMVALEVTVSLLQSCYLLDWRIRYEE